MKAIIAIILLSLLSLQVDAKNSGVSLNEAVNQVKSEGRVLSAKTIDGQHEIKILTPSGTVKTIHKKSANTQANNKPPRPEYYNNGGKSMRDRKQNTAIPNRFNSQQKTMKLNHRKLDQQPTRNNQKTTNKKDK